MSHSLPSIESRSPLTADEEAGLVLVAMCNGERPEDSQNWNAIDRLLAPPKEIKYKSVTLTEDDDEDMDNDADETYLVPREKRCKKTFTCDVCGKVLGSFQALGGHRSSRKCDRLKICDKNDQDRELVGKEKNDQDKRYECDFCGRVFESGQALGGHKRSHYV
ncbi:hypothetical protein N665_1266s0003 [Sinapis alba]|nr:hypothetical protein N665_1266s0003 [Sinapis alba]